MKSASLLLQRPEALRRTNPMPKFPSVSFTSVGRKRKKEGGKKRRKIHQTPAGASTAHANANTKPATASER